MQRTCNAHAVSLTLTPGPIFLDLCYNYYMAHRTPDSRLQQLNERDLLAAVVYGEARGEPVEGQVGVINVIHNRLTDGRWGPTLHRVILAWAQFSCMWPTLGGETNFKRILEFVDVLKKGSKLKPGTAQLVGLVDLSLNNALLDNTRTATHYYALTPQLIQEPPKWSKAPAIQTVMLGNHVFFKAVR